MVAVYVVANSDLNLDPGEGLAIQVVVGVLGVGSNIVMVVVAEAALDIEQEILQHGHLPQHCEHSAQAFPYHNDNNPPYGPSRTPPTSSCSKDNSRFSSH